MCSYEHVYKHPYIIYNIFVSAYSLMNKYELSLQLGTIMYWAQKKLQIAQ